MIHVKKAIATIQTLIDETQNGLRQWDYAFDENNMENIYISDGYIYKENNILGKLYDSSGEHIFSGFPYNLSQTLRQSIIKKLERIVDSHEQSNLG